MAMREDMRRNKLSCLFGIPALFWYFGLMVIPLFTKLVRPQCFCFWHFDEKEFGQYPASSHVDFTRGMCLRYQLSI